MLAAQPERRRMQRCELQEPVTIKFWDHGPREITGTVLNASPDGLFLQCEREIPEYSAMELVFLFPATLRSPGVRFLCQCCRTAGKGMRWPLCARRANGWRGGRRNPIHSGVPTLLWPNHEPSLGTYPQN
jgi:hypothetical protein